MTDEDLRWCDVCDDCSHYKAVGDEKYQCTLEGGRCRGYFAYKELESENAALRERMERAVELPFEVGSTVYTIYETDEEDKFNPSIDAGKIVSFSFDGRLWIFVRYNSGLTMWYTKDTFDKDVYITREAAEARLAELKGEEYE